ncbi:MAG: hypothetical protein NC212_01460 [Staphylococcus sp.]|nr:hypothetical protein [Staphylococcus sp.]
MTRLILTIFMLFPVVKLFGNNIYWENMNSQEKDAVLHSDSVPKIVIDIYSGKYELSDNDTYCKYLDYLLEPTSDDMLRAFKFHSFNKSLLKSDGAVAEGMGIYLYRLFQSDPEYVICYFDQYPDIMDHYVLAIAFELYCEAPCGPSSIPFQEFKKSVIDKMGEKHKEMTRHLLHDIEEKVNELLDEPKDSTVTQQPHVMDSVKSLPVMKAAPTGQVDKIIDTAQTAELPEKSLWQRIVDWFRALWDRIFG